jgi:predicted GIY-YIG superfamily endonuclease
MSKVGVDDTARPTADKVRFYYVYILSCSDGKPYTGCTDDLKDRIDAKKLRNIFKEWIRKKND